MQERLEVVNAELSEKKSGNPDDEPVPVSDIPPETVSVTVAVPAMAMADKPNLKPKSENISEKSPENNFKKFKGR